jgi:Lon protease-like protein
MTVLHPRLEDLPEEFPVFPLAGALLLPGGKLPLNIFEPRYIALVEDALAAGRMLGMVQPDKRLARGDNGPGLYRIGCLGRISAFEESGDGRYFITLSGLARFTIVEEVDKRHGYRRVRGAFSGFAADLQEPQACLPFERGVLVAALRRYFARTRVEANWDTIADIPDAALVVSLAMVCPFDVEEKQALLEARDEAERARVLLALLEIKAFEGGHDNDDEEPKAS